MKNNYYKVALLALVLFMGQAGLVLASEVSGTLSVGYQSQTAALGSNPDSQQFFFTVKRDNPASLFYSNGDVPLFIKVFLIGGVLLELMILVVLRFVKRQKRIDSLLKDFRSEPEDVLS